MIKKKAKKNQGVLLADEEHHIIPDKESSRQLEQKHHLTDKKQHHSQKHLETQAQHISLQSAESPSKHPQNEIEPHNQSQNRKRSKNPDASYRQDAHQYLENQPKRREKDFEKPFKPKGIISASTHTKKQDRQKQVHDAFNDIAHRAGTNLIQDMNLPEDELEEETAKRRYMENVERTKLIKEGKLNSKIYRGMNAYANHKLTENDIKNAEQSYKKIMGPSRINSTIKNTCRFDYVQNICKDWHDSGYCPFGNSCLYLHDRSNVKTGWELEKDFEQQERQRWKRINNPELAQKQDKQKLLKSISKYLPPELCQSCHQKFKDPVEVECGHIFCTSCAIKMLKCKSCSKKLSGIMNNAAQKLAKLKKNYEELQAKLQTQQEETQQKRRKFENVNNLDVFAD